LNETARASVVIPTIGRVELLRSSLESVAACAPRAGEIVVVDQSDDGVGDVVAEFDSAGARVVRSSGRGIALATNEGVAAARHDTVLVTHDDCTVAGDWIGRAVRLMADDPRQIVTGRVVPDGHPASVPSTRDSPTPCDFDSSSYPWVLCPHNMAFTRTDMLEFGGFDQRFTVAAEDIDLAYRWLKEGRPLRYRPEMVVWHHDWRAPAALKRTYLAYHRGRGEFYGKHLRRADLRMLWLLALDAYWTLVTIPAQLRERRRGQVHERGGVWRGVPAGLLRGLRR
jgi:GT2 family glycosyltransferase